MKRILLLAISILLAFRAQDLLVRKTLPTDAVMLFGLSVVLCCWALSAGRRRGGLTGAAAAAPGEWRAGRLTIRHFLLPLAALAPLAAALYAWNQNRFSTPESTAVFWLYIFGVTVFCSGVYGIGQAEGRLPSSNPSIFSRRVESLLLAGVMAVAAFLMLYQLDSIPFGVWYDEADSGLEALQTLNGAPYSPAAFRYRGNPSLYYQYLAIVFKLFGVGIMQIRYATILLGLLAVPAMYILAKQLFGQRVALVAAFFLAVCRWHFDFARFGMPNISAPLVEILVFFFLFRALQFKRWSDFVWAGLFVGLGIHTYTAFRMAAAAAAVVAVYWALSREIIPRLVKREFAEAWLSLRVWALRGVALIVAALITLGPLGLFAWQNPTEFNQRLTEASVFAKKDTDQAKLAALQGNIQKHILMFNYIGDGNGRHNLPGEPMLDPGTAAFLVLGIGYSLYRWRDARHSSLILWLIVTLLAGILSLDFEAPQGARTLVAVPVVCLLAAWPVGQSWGLLSEFAISWTRSPRGRRIAYGVAAAILTLVLGRIGLDNYQTYFSRQAKDFAVWNAFSAAETIVAKEANALGSGYDYYLADFFSGQPTIRFLAPWLKQYQLVPSGVFFPLRLSGERPAAIFLDAQKAGSYQAAKRYYPKANLRELKPSFGGQTAVYSVILTQEDIQSVQGLQARYFQGTDWQASPILERREPRLEADWTTAPPVKGAFSVEWSGVLYVPQYGQHVLAMTAPGSFQVYLDESLVLEGAGSQEGAALLARGNHNLRVRAVGGAGVVSLAWQPPARARATIPQESLYVPPVATNGLLGNYYRGLEWSGAPALAQIDPLLSLYFQITPLPRPYSVEWKGKLSVPSAGSYAFGLESIDDSWLILDERPVVETHVGNQYVESRLNLAAGLHDIRVRFVDKSGYSHINLYWTPPGGGREIVPSERLYPPQGAYPTPAPGVPGQGVSPLPPGPPAAAGPVPRLAFQASWGVVGEAPGEFREPRDVAVDSKGTTYVADTGNRRVQVFNSSGKFQSVLPGEFEEPLALVVDSRDNLLVLDSLTGWIYRYDANGTALGRFAGPAGRFYHPRGMTIDSQDNLYVADTGGCRLVKLSPGGDVLLRIGEKGSGIGQFLEPVDVAVDANGLMYVVDAGNRRIVRLDAAGNYVGEWAISPSSPANGPHLALAADGRVIVTDPEVGRLRMYANNGQLLAEAGRAGAADGQFRLPVGIFVDRGGRVYVADTFNHRVQILAGE
jgi:4-amino-4-deoxy-L-arabinose transferase-like glycosyltransferase/streptogramin lyase